jgi:hypothetical protein
MGQQRTIVLNETTDMFMSVRQKKKPGQNCVKKKSHTGKKENSKTYFEGHIIIKDEENLLEIKVSTHKTEKKEWYRCSILIRLDYIENRTNRKGIIGIE